MEPKEFIDLDAAIEFFDMAATSAFPIPEIMKWNALLKSWLEELREWRSNHTCVHASDCAMHNEPAYPIGACDCRCSDIKRKYSR